MTPSTTKQYAYKIVQICNNIQIKGEDVNFSVLNIIFVHYCTTIVKLE